MAAALSLGWFTSSMLGSLLMSIFVSSVLLVTGVLYFRRVERVFADIA